MRPSRMNEWKEYRLALLWPDPTVSSRAICHELDLGKRMLNLHAKRLGLGHRPTGTSQERKVA